MTSLLHFQWQQRELAAVLVSLGSVQSALEIYERLEMWTEVVECLCAGGRKGRAEEVVRERLGVAETPIMWCLLGDVTQVSWAAHGDTAGCWQVTLPP